MTFKRKVCQHFLQKQREAILREWNAYLGKLDLLRTHLAAGTPATELDDLRWEVRRHGLYLVNMGVLRPGKIIPEDLL